MPIYEFECDYGHRYEKLFSIGECPNKIPCEDCGLEGSMEFAEKTWSLPVYPSHGKPTIVFKNPRTDEVEIATYDGQQPPKGFVKEELRTPLERSKFERQQTAKQRIDDEVETEMRRERVNQTRKNRHDDLRSRMSDLASKSENPALTEALLKGSMERTRKKEVRAKKSEMRLDVNHLDKSNLMDR